MIIHHFFYKMRAPARHARHGEQRCVKFFRNVEHSVNYARKQVEVGAQTFRALVPFCKQHLGREPFDCAEDIKILRAAGLLRQRDGVGFYYLRARVAFGI